MAKKKKRAPAKRVPAKRKSRRGVVTRPDGFVEPLFGRPTSLTKVKAEKIAAYVANGMFWQRACAMVGVGKRVAWAWRARGRTRPGTIYEYFNQMMEKAKAQFEAFHLSNITDAARRGEWTSSAWALERVFPERYGKRVIEHKGHLVHHRGTDLSKLPVERLRELDKILAEAEGGGSNGEEEDANGG